MNLANSLLTAVLMATAGQAWPPLKPVLLKKNGYVI